MSDANSVITLYRRKSLCEITSGKVTTIPKITKIAFGEGGVDANGEPTTPLETETALKTPLKEYPIDSVTYPESTTARYTATIPADDLPGKKISEAALVDSDGKLCAIKHMYAKGKDSGVTFTFTFDDKY